MKGINRVVAFASVMGLMSVSSMAMASVSVPFGWYAEGNVGSSRVSSVSYGSGISLDTSGFGWSFNVGYKFIPYFAGEIGYTNYAQVDGKFNDTKVAKGNYHSYDIAGKAIYPISDTGFSIFGKLGVGRVQSNITESNAPFVAANGLAISTGSRSASGLYYGLGGEYYFMPNVAANVQWARINGSSTTGNLDLYSIGIGYVFG